MAFENLLQQIATAKGRVDTQKQAVDQQKQAAETANAAMTDPALAQARMSHVQVATHAKAAMDAANEAAALNAQSQAKLAPGGEFDQARAKAAAASASAQAAQAEAQQRFNPIDPDVNACGKAQADQAERVRQAAVDTGELAKEAAEQSAKAAEAAREAADLAKRANAQAGLAAERAATAAREAAKLSSNAPAGLQPPADQNFTQQSQLAKNGVAGIGNTPVLAKQASDAGKVKSEASAAAIEGPGGPITGIQQAATVVGNQLATPTATTPITGAMSDNQVQTRTTRSKEIADTTAQRAADAVAAADNAKNAVTQPAGPPPQSLQDLTANSVQSAGNVAAAMQPVYQAALAAAQQIPYNSDDNAENAKKAIDAAKKAGEEAEAAKKPCKDAQDALADAERQVKKAKDRLSGALGQMQQAQSAARAAEQARRQRKAEQLEQKLNELKKAKERAESRISQRNLRVERVKAALERAKETAKSLPEQAQGVGVCDAVPVLEKERQQADAGLQSWQETLRDVLRQIAETEAEIRTVSDPQQLREAILANPKVQAAADAARQAADEAKAVEQDLPLVQAAANEVKQLCAALAKAAEDAKAAKDQAVSARIEQLKAEGHGPQRHEGQVTPQDLGERAVYTIDPETHTQLDAESGELHSADPVASKFTSEEIYVDAEARSRKELKDKIQAAPAQTVVAQQQNQVREQAVQVKAQEVQQQANAAAAAKQQLANLQQQREQLWQQAPPPADRDAQDDALRVQVLQQRTNLNQAVQNQTQRQQELNALVEDPQYAAAVEQIEKLQALPNTSGSEVSRPLTDLGKENKVAEGVRNTWGAAQPKVQTSKGQAKAVPTNAAFVGGSPPPARLDMNTGQMATEIAAHSAPVDFTGGTSFAVYRKDASGNWFLRTMWSQPV